jgi:hypothetical protein
MSMNSDGMYVVAWSDPENVVARRYNLDGPVDSSPFEVHHAIGSVRSVRIADDGHFLIAWIARLSEESPMGDAEVFARSFSTDGTPAADAFMVNTYTSGNQTVPDIAIFPGGQFMIVWSSEGPGDDPSDIFAQRFDASGNPLGTLPW